MKDENKAYCKMVLADYIPTSPIFYATNGLSGDGYYGNGMGTGHAPKWVFSKHGFQGGMWGQSMEDVICASRLL